MKRNHSSLNNIKNDGDANCSNHANSENDSSIKFRKIGKHKIEKITSTDRTLLSFNSKAENVMEVEEEFNDAGAKNDDISNNSSNDDESYTGDESSNTSYEENSEDDQGYKKIIMTTNKKSILKKSAAAAGITLVDKANIKNRNKIFAFKDKGEEIPIDEDDEEQEEVEEFLPCRETEMEYIDNYIKKGLQTNGTYSALYISGMPGTGKTACVNAVIKKLRNEFQQNYNLENADCPTINYNSSNKKVIEVSGTAIKSNKKSKTLSHGNNRTNNTIQKSVYYPNRFSLCFINGMKIVNQNIVFKIIYESIFTDGRNKSPQKTISLLDQFFKNRDSHNFKFYLKDPTNPHLILVIDEIDCLTTKKQVLLYNIFNWTTYTNSKLIIISISNTLDLPEKLLPKISSRIGNNRLTFKPYKTEELNQILALKVKTSGLFSEDALRLCCMKVASLNGDLRRVLQICRRAKEIFENEEIMNKNHKNLNKEDGQSEVLKNITNNSTKKIEKQHILKACSELFDSKVVGLIREMKIYEKVILVSIVDLMRIKDDTKIKLSQLYERHKFVGLKLNITRNLNFEEFRNIVYNLNRLKILSFSDNNCENFIENSIYIKFYTDEIMSAMQGQENFLKILEGDYSSNLLPVNNSNNILNTNGQPIICNNSMNNNL